MKLKLLLFLLSGVLLNSCYKFDSLPEKYISSYELIVPLLDTTIKIVNFEDLKGHSPSYEISKDTKINMGEISCLIYFDKLGDLEIVELLPQMILEAGGMQGAKVSLQVYTHTDNGKDYFWIPENYTFTIENNKTVISEAPAKIDLLKNADRVYINVILSFPENISVSRLISEKINMKIGAKVKMKNNLEIKL